EKDDNDPALPLFVFKHKSGKSEFLNLISSNNPPLQNKPDDYNTDPSTDPQSQREAEKSQLEISSQDKGAGGINLKEIAKEINQGTTSDEENQPAPKENQQNQLQKTDNKDNKNVYYGIGAISLVLLVIDSYKNETTAIRISKGTELEGVLEIKDYPQLKEIFLGGAKGITELKIINCPAVETLFVSDNQITKIEGLTDLSKLKKLSFGGNKLEEIDISKNTELEMLYFRDNPTALKFANGIKNLSKLIKELKEIAKELGLDGEGKSLDEIKQAIKDELDKNKQNKEKLEQELPGLFGTDGKVDESKLGEIKDKAEKGNNYDDLVEKNPDLIVDGKIDQSKLNDLNDKGKKFDDLKNTMDAIGIDPNNVADATKNIKELKALEESVIAYFGKDYKERLKVETYQAYIEDKSIKKIELYDENRKAKAMEELTGELVIKDYTELEEIDFKRWDKKVKDKITKVTIENCPKVKNINFDNSETTEIIFQGSFPNLARLDLPDNKLTKIDVSKLPNLTNLNIARNPNLTEITDDLKNRPTQEDLNKAAKDAEDKAVKNTEDKFKDYINPNDPTQKDKLEAAAKNQGMQVEKDIKEAQSQPATGTVPSAEQQQKIDNLIKIIEKQNEAIKKYGDELDDYQPEIRDE
ncbi:26727_t:CDS:2, partial [Racocetra persica]